MKTKTKIFTFVMYSALILCAVTILSISVQAADLRTPLSNFVATSNITEPTYGDSVVDGYSFTLSEGAPAKTANHMSSWHVYDEQKGYWTNYEESVFFEGRYYYSVQIRIDAPYGDQYIFANESSVTVNGEEWTLESINTYATYSYAYIRSPYYTIEKLELPLKFTAGDNQNIPENNLGIEIGPVSLMKCVIGGKEPYTFQKVSGPSWISVSADGTVSGTPSELGDNDSLTVRVTDAAGVSLECSLSVGTTKPDPANRESVSRFTVTSNMGTPAVGDNCTTAYSFNFSEGNQAYFSISMSYWEKYENGVWNRFNGSVFTEGTFRYSTQIRIDGNWGETHKLAESFTLTVDGNAWSHSRVLEFNGYSYTYVSSPEIILKLESITDIAIIGAPSFTLGSTPILDTNSISLPDNAPFVVQGLGWFDETNEEWLGSEDTFLKDHHYLFSIQLSPKNGYVFAPQGELTATIDGEAAAIMRNGNSVMVQISFGTPTAYRISFEADGGTGNMDSVFTGGSYVLPNCSFPPPDGKVFDHWSVTDLGPHAPGEIIIITNDITVTAQWKDAPVYYTVTFVAGEHGQGSRDPETKESMTVYSLPENPFTSDSKYFEFSHWSVNGVSNKNPGDNYTLIENITLVAIWKHRCVLDTVDGYGASCATETAGKQTYYRCDYCKNNYSDADGANPISENIADWGNIPYNHSFTGDIAIHDTSTHGFKCTNAGCDKLGNFVLHDHGDWKFSSDMHYKECACGDRINESAHTDTDNNGQCDDCNFETAATGPVTSEQTPDTSEPEVPAMSGQIPDSSTSTTPDTSEQIKNTDTNTVSTDEGGGCAGCGGFSAVSTFFAILCGTGVALVFKKKY